MLTPQESYCIACVLQGKPLPEIADVSATWRGLLANASKGGTEGQKALQKSLSYLLDGDSLKQVMSADTDAPPPAPPPRPVRAADAFIAVPPLPKGVALTAAQEKAAGRVGEFERRYTHWASRVANESPISFQQSSAFALLAAAIGRRVYIATPWQQKVYVNQYILQLAVTTYNRKSTGLNITRTIIDEAFPHLLMPRPGSTENFGNMLAGKWETDGLPQEDKEELERARPFAGQRVIIRDEISGLFRSFGRDHMAGLKEDLMDMYECPNRHRLSTNSKGIVIARNIAPTLIGASTPVGMALACSQTDWEDGNLARFALVTPEEPYEDRPAPPEIYPATEFIDFLRDLHKRLPFPQIAALGQSPQAEEWSLVAPIWDEVRAYASTLREFTNPNRTDSLDNRLRGTYGRHHVKAIKIALALATADWHASGTKDERPTVTKAHWYRAQSIAEDWRASAHRFLHQTTLSEDADAAKRVRTYIAQAPLGITMSDLINATRLKAGLIKQSVEILMESGQVEAFKERRGGRGPEATCYRLIN